MTTMPGGRYGFGTLTGIGGLLIGAFLMWWAFGFQNPFSTSEDVQLASTEGSDCLTPDNKTGKIRNGICIA